jgi:hypothetical protein
MLRPGAKPGFATVGKLLSALGVRFEVTPVKSASPVKRVRKLRDDAPVAVAAAKTVATKKRARA